MAAMLVLIRHEAGYSFVPFQPTTERGKGNDDTKLVTPIPSHLRAGKVIMRRGKGGAGVDAQCTIIVGPSGIPQNSGQLPTKDPTL